MSASRPSPKKRRRHKRTVSAPQVRRTASGAKKRSGKSAAGYTPPSKPVAPTPSPSGT